MYETLEPFLSSSYDRNVQYLISFHDQTFVTWLQLILLRNIFEFLMKHALSINCIGYL